MPKPRHSSKTGERPAMQAGRDFVLHRECTPNRSGAPGLREGSDRTALRAWVRRYVAAIVEHDAAARAGTDGAGREVDTG
jgi:hypothetical protein